MSKQASKAKQDASKVLAGVKAGITPAVTLSDSEKARIVGEARAIGVKRTEARFEAAKYIHAAYAAGYVGTRQKAGSVWKTGADLMRDMQIPTNREYGDLRILGVATSVGITPDHRAWGLVSSHAGAASLNQISKSAKPTITAFEKAAKSVQAEKDAAAAKRASKATTPRKGAAEKRADEKQAEKQAAKQDGSAYALATAALGTLRESRGALSVEQARTIRASLATLLSEYGETVATPVASGE